MDETDPFLDSYEDVPDEAAPPPPRWSDSSEDEPVSPPPGRWSKPALRPVPPPPPPSSRPVYSDASPPSSHHSTPRAAQQSPRSGSTTPRSTVVCWVCGEVNAAYPESCSQCQEPPLVDVEEFSSSVEEDGPPPLPDGPPPLPPPMTSPRRPSSPAASSLRSASQMGPAPVAPRVASVPLSSSTGSAGGLRGPSAARPVRAAPSPPSSVDEGGKGERRASPRATPTSPRRARRAVVVKAPSGAQTPDFCNVKRSPDGSWAGWLYKQKAQGRMNLVDGGWKARYVVWDPTKARLYYYHYEGEQDFANFVSFDSKTQVRPLSSLEHCPDPALLGCAFEVTASYTHRPYVFCAGSPETCDEWVQDLLECVSAAERLESGGEQTIEEVWTSYEESKNNAEINGPVLEVIIEEGSFAAKHEYFVACYGSNDQKFRTWISKPTAEPTWGCDGTFSGAQDKIRLKAFSRNHVTGGHKELAEVVINVKEYARDTVVDEWFTLKGKRAGDVFKVRLRLQHTTAFNFDSINGSRGVPTQVLPLRLDTGDIILFHNSHLASQATKMFTMSQWDHIAIVIRWKDNGLKLFEATGNGVGLFNLKARLEFLHSNTKMAVRRLSVRRTPEMLKALDGFIQMMRGRHYKKRLGVLVKAAVSNEKETSKDDEDLSTVFCSELVIASYQKMKLMSDKFAAKAFLPKDLADKDNFVELENDAKLDRKRIFSRKKNRAALE